MNSQYLFTIYFTMKSRETVGHGAILNNVFRRMLWRLLWYADAQWLK